jgi:hypothetical protein
MLWVGQDSLQTQGLQSFNLKPTDTSLPGPCLLIVEMDLMLSLSALVAACQLGYAKKPLQQLASGLSLEETADPAETRAPVAALGEIRS